MAIHAIEQEKKEKMSEEEMTEYYLSMKKAAPIPVEVR